MDLRYLVCSAIALTLSAADAAAQWQTIATGVEYQKSTYAGPNNVYVLRVDLCAPGLRMRATAPGEGPRTVPSFGQLVGGVAAINGDWPAKDGYIPSLPSTSPRGLSVGDGKHFPGTEDPAFYGFFAFGHNNAKHSEDAEALGAPGALFFLAFQDVVSGQPTLVYNGQARSNTASHCGVRNPRTIVGIDATNTKLLLAVVDGRTAVSVGMTCNEAAAFMLSLGAHSAELQDGGGSSTMWLASSGVVNQPSDGSLRSLVNHWAVLAAGKGPPRSCATREILGPDKAVMRGVPSPAVMAAWHFDFADVFLMADAEIAKYAKGASWPAGPPELIQGSGAAIYVKEGTAKRHVPSPYAMQTWRFVDFQVNKVSDAEIAALADGAAITPTPVLVRGTTDTVWVIDRAPPAANPNADAGAPVPGDGGAPLTDGSAPTADGAPVGLDWPAGADGTLRPAGDNASSIDDTTGGCACDLGAAPHGRIAGLCLLALILAARQRRRGHRRHRR